jgi:hypothetical protein
MGVLGEFLEAERFSDVEMHFRMLTYTFPNAMTGNENVYQVLFI